MNLEQVCIEYDRMVEAGDKRVTRMKVENYVAKIAKQWVIDFYSGNLDSLNDWGDYE